MHNILRQHTLSFWIVSRTWQGHPVQKITTESALKTLSKAASELSPRFKIVRRSATLRDDIVRGPITTPKASVGG